MASNVIEQIQECINNNKNFLLSGGAGSGKTYTLGQVLEYIYAKNNIADVACITYTNVAVDEIKERFPYYKTLRVSTIHDFLWDNIKDFQKNLRKSLYELILMNNADSMTGIKYSGEVVIAEDYFEDKQVQYREYKKLEEGIISHDEVLTIANYMFGKYSLLSTIIKDKYPYILIDEYQDTDRKVIQIFLEYLQINSPKTNTVGLFGDSMQAIYDNKGVGDIQDYVSNGVVQEILKQDNYRCSKKVITLINKIRDDSIKQEPAREDENGVILNKEGSIKFLYSGSTDIKRIKASDIFSEWDFDNTLGTKELYLTHKLISKECGFIDLLQKYPKDRLMGDSRDKLIKHLYKINEIIDFYNEKQYSELVKKINIKIEKPSDKKKLKESFDDLLSNIDNTIENIIDKSDELNLIKKDDTLNEFIVEKTEHYESIKDISFSQIVALSEYELEKTPYSTQHGVKGAEFENVLVILDNGGWNNYSFKHLFENTTGKEKIIKRTQKIFYVCCSRAKNNLVVFSESPTSIMLSKAKELFGSENVIAI